MNRMKEIYFHEYRKSGRPYYSIYIDRVLWYGPSADPPGWFFFVGMMQQYGGQIVEVVHDVIE
jgi:hypothetical protein